MDADFEQFQYCQDDPVFYTRPSAVADTSPAFRAEVPSSWHAHRDGEWSMHSASAKANVPEQGWKVHISTTLEDADSVLNAAASVCASYGVAFKHLATARALFLRNSKNYPRGHAGKFITCYPPVEMLEEFLDKLEIVLNAFSGPYILSDKRWKSAPIYLRYGAFRRMTMSIDGTEVPAVRNTDGALVPDERHEVFSVPDWAEIPECLAEWIDSYPDDAADAATPFQVTTAIKFSNGGGTYRGSMKSNPSDKVVVKEARAHAGLDGARRTAAARLRTERDALSKLAVYGLSPQVRWFGTLWEHDFLCIEYLEGPTLQKWIGRNFPMYFDTDEGVYYQRVHAIAKELVRAIELFHAAGWTHQDLHPRNVILESVEPIRLKIIDFEGARPLSNSTQIQDFGFPGFRSLRDRTPQGADWHGVRQIVSYMVLPLINLCELNERYTQQTVEFAQRRNTSGPAANALTAVRALLDEITDRADGAGGEHETGERYLSVITEHRALASSAAMVDATVSGVEWALRNAPGEALPTHYEGLSDGQHGLAYGASGLLAALTGRKSGQEDVRSSALIATITERATESLYTATEVGLFTGTVGDLVGLHMAGHESIVKDYLDGHNEDLFACDGQRTYDGLPGVLLGLTWLIARGAPVSPKIKQRVREELDSLYSNYRSNPGEFAPVGEPGRIMANQSRLQDSGLLYGHLGISWLFATAARQFSESKWIEGAYEAAQNEISRYRDDKGRLQFQQAGRLLPYLATGSAGFGIVLPLLPPRFIDASLREVASKCLAAVRLDFCSAAGLFNGYAGLLMGASGLCTVLGLPRELTRDNLRALELHTLTSGNDRLFGGDSEFRLSVDLATGSAGIVFALSHLGLRTQTSDRDVSSGPEEPVSTHKAPVT